jgi:mono/diheme cytochrome c family protein
MKVYLLGALLGPLFITQVSLAQIKVDQATLDKGKRLYLSNCIQCHNKDPNLKGSLGPELVDAPLEIVYAKVMTGVYPAKLPAGFVPKRSSKVMRKIPKLEKDIPAIHAWIQSVKKKK